MTLTPSERIQLIKGIVPKLAKEGFGNAELVLDNFLVPGPIDWSGGHINDLMRNRISQTTDEILLAIGKHYDLPAGPISAETELSGEPNFRLPMAVCAAVAEVITGSHATLDALFEAAGASGPPPDLAHHSKWKTWLFRAGNDPSVDSLALVGNLIEEFMDLPPRMSNQAVEIFGVAHDPIAEYEQQRDRLNNVLEEHGFRYFRGGRVLPDGQARLSEPSESRSRQPRMAHEPRKPAKVEELIETLVRGLPRAMHPLTHRRKDAQTLSFESEYDIQDLLHSQLRPWITDIRPEEFTPSYASSSTRMDFLLPAHELVIEMKRIRDKRHASKVGDELIIDIEHYRQHRDCRSLWCVVYDPLRMIVNPSGLTTDLEGPRTTSDGTIDVRVFVLSG